jgi:hypothetical protein
VLCGGAFAYAGIAAMSAASRHGHRYPVVHRALFGTVLCLVQHTNRVRAELKARIRALSASEEKVRDLL